MAKVIGTDVKLINKATFKANDRFVSSPDGRVMGGKMTVSTKATATAITLTAAEVLGGMILQDPTGGAVTTNLPTAALLSAALGGAIAGDSLEFTIRNTADANETITVEAGTGGTMSGTKTIAQNNSKRFLIVFSSKSVYTAYSLGTVTH